MSKPSKRQKGAVRHAEGQHGEKTHAAFLEQISSRTTTPEAEASPQREGKQRLQEDREQHDEADKNAEKNRARRTNSRDEDSTEA